MIVLVGLGNPGTEYADTRHNVGFMAVDEIVRRYSFTPFHSKFKGEVASGTIDNEKVLVLKPQTYMNLSGESVLALCSFYKIKPEQIIVFHDDLDLPVGKVKVKQGGSAGGHNGLKNIDSHIGQNYVRVRIGTDKPVIKGDVVNWVLNPFPKTDKQKIESVIDNIATHISLLIRGNSQTFMNKLSGQ